MGEELTPVPRERNVTLVTTDTAEAFYNERLGTDTTTGATVSDTVEGAAGEDTKSDEEHEEVKKGSPKLQERFSELTSKRKAAEAQA